MNNKPLETLLEEKELAETLQVSIGTLRTWRTDGKGHRLGAGYRTKHKGSGKRSLEANEWSADAAGATGY